MDWRMQWVASTLHTTSEHGVSSITTADAAHLSCQQSTELTPTGRFKWTRSVSRERRNLVSARVPSHFNWPLKHILTKKTVTSQQRYGFSGSYLCCFPAVSGTYPGLNRSSVLRKEIDGYYKDGILTKDVSSNNAYIRVRPVSNNTAEHLR